MSRIGKKPITIPKSVTVKVLDDAVEVQGPKGKLKQGFPSGINFELADGHLLAKRASDNPEHAKFHGLARSLVANAVTGVTALVEFVYRPSSDSPNRSSGNRNAVICSLPSDVLLYALTTPLMMLNTAVAL